MNQEETCDAVLEAAHAPATFRRWIARPSVEAVAVRARLEGIVGLFHDLDASLGGLGYRGDQAACQLAHQVRAAMIQASLVDLARHPPAGFGDNTMAAPLSVRLNRLLPWRWRGERHVRLTSRQA